MKQKLLKTMLLLCALVVGGVSSVWADTTGTINFGSATGSTKIEGASSSGTGTVTYTDSGSDSQGNTWTITTITSNDKSFTQNASYSQVGSSNKAVTSITLTTTLSEDVNIKSLSAKFGGFSNTAGTVTLKVGDTTVGSGSLNGTSDVTVSSSSAQTGKVLTVTVTGIAKGVKVYYISYTYAAAASGEETTTTIDASGITNTNVYAGTEAGSLSASVTYGTPAAAVPTASVTWRGDDDEVATINASTGEVTLVGAGTVTFTATYVGVADTYQPSSDTYEMTVTNEDPSIVTIWSEDFSTYDADDVPNGDPYSYKCTDGGGTSKIYTQNTAGGTSPELLIGKTNGTFSATIPLLHSTYGYSGDLTLTFKSNTTINVKTTTDGITVDGEENEGEGVSFSTKDTHTVTFKGVTTVTENITIVFTATSGSNVRLDDIVLRGKQAELTIVATPSISPASGAVASGTEVTMTCATAGATIYYTTNGDTPTSSSTAYNPASKPTITSACTIKAIGIKTGLTNSAVASASYTIAAPCATPTFSVAEGEVTKGTTVSISCATDGATIYYTTDGTTPTTSSTVYSSAITINTAQTIKAIAAKDGNANSEVASATYTVIDYTTLPFYWAGGIKDDLTALTGVTASGLGTNYAAENAPYRVKMDTEGDYIQIKTNAQPVKVLIGVKMVGGATTSKIKVQESANGSSFTDVEELTISGISNAILSLKTTSSFDASTRYVRIIKSVHGSNIGVGPIIITDFDDFEVTLNTSGYATYASTYPLDFSDDSEYSAWQITAVNSSTGIITFSQITGAVKAGTGVLLKGSASDDISIPVAASGSDISATNLLKGITTAKTVDDDEYYGLKGDTFKKVNAGTVPAGKALLPASELGSVKSFTFIFEGATGVRTVEKVNAEEAEAIFNLAGQRIQKPQRGINIINGRKVVVK